jgi:hypothetical protein
VVLALITTGLVASTLHFALPTRVATAAAEAATTTVPSTTVPPPSTEPIVTTTVAPTTTPPTTAPTTVPVSTTTMAPVTTTSPSSSSTSLPAHSAPGCPLSQSDVTPVKPTHCVVLSIGDSLGQGLGWELAREFAPTSGFTLIQKAKSSSGLANHAFYNWPAQFALLEKIYHPNIAIVFLGGNDAQGTYTAQGVGAPFGTVLWRTTYVSAIQAIVHTAALYGTQVLWVGMPVCQAYYYNLKMMLLDHLYAQVASTASNDTFLATTTLLANANGGFRLTAYVNGQAVDLRSVDGIHMSSYGYAVVATYVVQQLAEHLHVLVHPAAPAFITR